MKGEFTYWWKVGEARTFELFVKADDSVGAADIPDMVLSDTCGRTGIFAIPPNKVLVEIETWDGSWTFATARWHEGQFVRSSGILSIQPPDPRVFVEIVREIPVETE